MSSAVTTPAPDFALVRSTTFSPAEPEERPRSLDNVSARPLRITPRPEEALFQTVQDQRDQDSSFQTRFEEPRRDSLTLVDARRQPSNSNNNPATATALPILPLRASAKPSRSKSINNSNRVRAPLRRRPQQVTTTFRPTTTEDPEYEYYYEYYYDDEDEETLEEPRASHSNIVNNNGIIRNELVSRSRPPVKSIDDYDLGPVANKVNILDNGKTECHDVGVFPHPDSCRKFVMCSRRATREGITGWVYECPAYLAFDPVGGRCNWATDVVCS